MKSILILTMALLFAFEAQSAISFTSAKLSSALGEYDAAHATGDSGVIYPMYGVIFPDANGVTGVSGAQLIKPGISQVTGKYGPPLYKGASGNIPLLELVGLNQSTRQPIPLVLPSSALGKIAVVTCSTYAGGAASAALTCTGLLSTDTVLAVTQKTSGSGTVAVNGYSSLGADALTVFWTGTQASGTVVQATVLHQ